MWQNKTKLLFKLHYTAVCWQQILQCNYSSETPVPRAMVKFGSCTSDWSGKRYFWIFFMTKMTKGKLPWVLFKTTHWGCIVGVLVLLFVCFSWLLALLFCHEVQSKTRNSKSLSFSAERKESLSTGIQWQSWSCWNREERMQVENTALGFEAKEPADHITDWCKEKEQS